MMYIVMFVSKNVDQASDVLQIWIKTGVDGVTILESAGMHQVMKQRGIRDDFGIFPTLNSLMRAQEIHHRTLFSAVRDEAMLDKVVEATTEYVGDWAKPDVGVLFVWPLVQAYGMDKSFK